MKIPTSVYFDHDFGYHAVAFALRLRPDYATGALLQGTVQDPTHAPIPGATVESPGPRLRMAARV